MTESFDMLEVYDSLRRDINSNCSVADFPSFSSKKSYTTPSETRPNPSKVPELAVSLTTHRKMPWIKQKASTKSSVSYSPFDVDKVPAIVNRESNHEDTRLRIDSRAERQKESRKG